MKISDGFNKGSKLLRVLIKKHLIYAGSHKDVYKFRQRIVFSADLCYNGADEKAPFWREPLDTCHLRGMGFAQCLCNTKAKLAIKRTDKLEFIGLISNLFMTKNNI